MTELFVDRIRQKKILLSDIWLFFTVKKNLVIRFPGKTSVQLAHLFYFIQRFLLKTFGVTQNQFILFIRLWKHQ